MTMVSAERTTEHDAEDRAPVVRTPASSRIRDAAFRQTWKGYDTAQVDDFLDDLVTIVEDLESRLGESDERLAMALQAAASVEQRSVRSDGDDAIRRTLVLAQRAADLVVSEARAVADRITADARDRAAAASAEAERHVTATIEAAERRAEAITEQAEAVAERRAAQRAAEIQAELSSVVEERTRRQGELEEIRAELDRVRSQQRAFLEEQLRIVSE